MANASLVFQLKMDLNAFNEPALIARHFSSQAPTERLTVAPLQVILNNESHPIKILRLKFSHLVNGGKKFPTTPTS